MSEPDTRKFIPPDQVADFLKKYYDDPATGLRGRDALFAKISKEYSGISRRRIAEFLKNQETAQVHMQVPSVPITRPAVLRKEGQWAVDLTFLKRSEPGAPEPLDNQILFTCIDQFSKFAWVQAVPNKTGKTIAGAMKQVIDSSKAAGTQLPRVVRSDNGSEFKAKEFAAVLKDVGAVQRFSEAYNPRQNAMIERFNKTIKEMIHKYMTQWNLAKVTQKQIQKLVDNYNSTRHGTTESAPADIHAAGPGSDEAKLAHANMRARAQKLVRENRSKYPELVVGDKVRVARRTESSWRANHQLKKYSYMRNWTYDIFTISGQTHGSTTKAKTYSLQDEDGDMLVEETGPSKKAIPKQFMRQDLQKVDEEKLIVELEEGEYVIDKVIAKEVEAGKTLYKVSWVGHDDTSWIPGSPSMKDAIAKFERKVANKKEKKR